MPQRRIKKIRKKKPTDIKLQSRAHGLSLMKTSVLGMNPVKMRKIKPQTNKEATASYRRENPYQNMNWEESEKARLKRKKKTDEDDSRRERLNIPDRWDAYKSRVKKEKL
ncbi:MAG TPA: hypothetical protein EYF95_08090 [Flavobacteriales bacterium]|jgi:hypothetical protein|nr:hypothetical protein [Flavobacteriales bacterium]HIK67916.1 hypothetical protein [Flavobacteriales bacterium]